MTCRHKTPARQRGSFTYYFFVFHSSLTRGRFGEVISNSEEVQATASRERRASINAVDFQPKVWYNYKKVMSREKTGRDILSRQPKTPHIKTPETAT